MTPKLRLLLRLALLEDESFILLALAVRGIRDKTAVVTELKAARQEAQRYLDSYQK